MNNISFKLNTGFTYISNEFIDKYMVLSPVYSMVYIYGARLACQNISATNKDIAEKLNIFESDVVKAWKFWQNKGLIKYENNSVTFCDLSALSEAAPTSEIKTVKKTKNVFYNPTDINKLSENDKNIKQLISSAEKIIGKTLSPNNTNILMNIYDNMGLSYEVIITLIQYYSDKPLSYIEKVAISWSEKGITTIEQAEAELNSYGIYSKIIKFFGVTDRNFTQPEKKYMEVWINDFKLPLDIIKVACERTIKNTGKVSLAYANKILTNWHENGIKTIEDIAKLDEANSVKNNKTKPAVKPIKNIFNNYDQKIYTDEEINEILRRKANQ